MAPQREGDRRAARLGDQRRLRRPRWRQRALHGGAAPQHAARQQRERLPRRLPSLGRREDEGEAREELIAADQSDFAFSPASSDGMNPPKLPLLITRTTSPGSAR